MRELCGDSVGERTRVSATERERERERWEGRVR
jgi:hypothetical protein